MTSVASVVPSSTSTSADRALPLPTTTKPCMACLAHKPKTSFSKRMWKEHPSRRRCHDCVADDLPVPATHLHQPFAASPPAPPPAQPPEIRPLATFPAFRLWRATPHLARDLPPTYSMYLDQARAAADASPRRITFVLQSHCEAEMRVRMGVDSGAGCRHHMGECAGDGGAERGGGCLAALEDAVDSQAHRVLKVDRMRVVGPPWAFREFGRGVFGECVRAAEESAPVRFGTIEEGLDWAMTRHVGYREALVTLKYEAGEKERGVRHLEFAARLGEHGVIDSYPVAVREAEDVWELTDFAMATVRLVKRKKCVKRDCGCQNTFRIVRLVKVGVDAVPFDFPCPKDFDEDFDMEGTLV